MSELQPAGGNVWVHAYDWKGGVAAGARRSRSAIKRVGGKWAEMRRKTKMEGGEEGEGGESEEDDSSVAKV